VRVLFTSFQNIVILSIVVIVHAGIKSTNVVWPHDATYNTYIFAIFSKTDFVDIAPLCCKPSKCFIAVHRRFWALSPNTSWAVRLRMTGTNRWHATSSTCCLTTTLKSFKFPQLSSIR